MLESLTFFLKIIPTDAGSPKPLLLLPHHHIQTCQVDESPADIDVRADVVRLDLDGAPEVVEGLAKPRLGLEGVANVVEELGVARVNLQSGLKQDRSKIQCN